MFIRRELVILLLIDMKYCPVKKLYIFAKAYIERKNDESNSNP